MGAAPVGADPMGAARTMAAAPIMGVAPATAGGVITETGTTMVIEVATAGAGTAAVVIVPGELR